MERSQVDQAVVQDAIRHLFDPRSPSRSATRALISPNLILDFPLLHNEYDPTGLASHGSTFKRHSPSAQALSVFRLAALVVNHLPRSEWNLTEIKEVEEIPLEDDSGASRWTAVLRWELTLQLPLSLPFHLDDQLVMHHQDTRKVELLFAPRQTLEQRRIEQRKSSNEPSGSGSRKRVAENRQVQLAHVRYTGVEQPAFFHLVPLHETISKLVHYLCAFITPLVYGLLLLLGLDHSTRSLDASRRKRVRQEKRKLKLESRVTEVRGKGKGKATEQTRFPSDDDASDFSATSFSLADDHALESTYHRIMRNGNGAVQVVTRLASQSMEVISQTMAEVSMVGWAIRRTVVLAVEGSLSLLGVGADVLNFVGTDLGGNSSEEQRVRELKHATRYSKSDEDEQATSAISDEPLDDYTSKRRSSSSSGKKRVSFSLASAHGDGLVSADAAFSQFKADMDEVAGSRAGTVHIDIPIPSPQVEKKSLPSALKPDESTAHVASQSSTHSPITPPRSRTRPSNISSPVSSRSSTSPAPTSTSISEREEDRVDEPSSLGVVFGPRHAQEHLQSLDPSLEQEEEREIDELVGITPEHQAIGALEGSNEDDDPESSIFPSVTTSVAESPISGAALAAAAEEHLYSPASTSTPFLSPDIPFPPSPTNQSQGFSTSSLSPSTPVTSPEMNRQSFSRGAEAEGAKSTRMEHESSGSWSSQGGVVSEGAGTGSVTVGEGHPGIRSGTRVIGGASSSTSALAGVGAPRVGWTEQQEASSKSKKERRKKSNRKKGGAGGGGAGVA